MSPLLLYSTCVVGAVGLYLVLRPGRRSARVAGAILGLAALVYLGLRVAVDAGGAAWGPGTESPIFFGLFSVIAILGAVRMITHPRPVFAALYFVLVVLSSAALFLMLQAEFIAFALVIVYAGAILITYMFVLMLAQQATEDDVNSSAEYDRIPREPAAAIIIGLVLVAAIADSMVGPASRGGSIGAVDATAGVRNAWRVLDEMPKSREREARAIVPDLESIVLDPDGNAVYVDDSGVAFMDVRLADGSVRTIELPQSALPGNTQAVGMALVARFPVSLEVAGIILTMAMFGAVVLARRQIELGEDRLRESVGLRRLTVDESEAETGAQTGAQTGDKSGAKSGDKTGNRSGTGTGSGSGRGSGSGDDGEGSL